MLSHLITFALLAAGTQEGAPAEGPLVVGTKTAEPFVIEEPDGGLTGLAIELWRGVADELGLDYRFETTDLEGLLAGVERGDYDVGVGALTVTAEREADLDFTHTILTSGLGIAVDAEAGGFQLAALGRLVSVEFASAVASLAVLLAVVGAAVWFLERRRNPEQFGRGFAGLLDGFWFSAVTMTTVGYGDKAPVTRAGRLVTLVWMFASIIVISGFTAAIATSLTIGSLESKVAGVDDLPGAQVAVLADSAAADWARSVGARVVDRPTVRGALDALAAGEVDAVVHDAPILRYLVQERESGNLRVLADSPVRQDYAFALPAGSPRREELNRALLAVLASDGWQERLERYLGR